MTCIMDPVYARQPVLWPSQPPPMVPIEMEFSIYPHPTFTSPPATPMTPITPATPHHTTFAPLPQYEQQIPAPPYPGTMVPPPLPPLPDYRLYTLCQYLQNYSQVPDSELKLWWDEFMAEFFHENATLAIEVDLGEGIRKFCLTRQWIVFYFKSLLENGVASMHIKLGQCIRTFHQSMQQLECRNCLMETDHSSPHLAKVCTSGLLMLDFSLEEKPRIISWYFHIKDHVEYIPRSNIGKTEDPSLTTNITCKGIPPATEKFLMNAGMMESGLQDPSGLPTSSVTPNSVDIHNSLPTHWQAEPMSYQSTLDGTLQSVPPSSSHPPPLTPCTSMLQYTQLPTTAVFSTACGSSHRPKSSRSSSSSSSKKSRNSPTAKKNQFILVAAEAVPLTEDMAPGLIITDERTITKVSNPKTTAPTPGVGSDTVTVSQSNLSHMQSLQHAMWPSDTTALTALDHNSLSSSR